MTPSFIHLRVHTQYSLLEGALKVEKLIPLCVKENMPAVAMTDTNNMYGIMNFSKTCEGAGVQPILGTQLLLKREPEDGNALTLKEDIAPVFDKIVLLVQNEVGYQNILKIFNRFYLAEGKEITPHTTLEELEEYQNGLILLSGGVEGPIGHYLLDGKTQKADEITQRLQKMFPNRFYMELQRHGMDTEIETEGKFLELSSKYDIPLVATNEVFFENEEMFEAQDALICIAEKTYVDEEKRRHLTPEHYFKTADEMCELFKDLPEALQNTVEIAKRCAFDVGKRSPALPNFDCKGKSEREVLLQKTYEGFEEKMKDRSKEEKERYKERLEEELKIITQMGFEGYFLIVADFIQWSKKHGIPVGPGRGSGAGSVVAWSLTITDIDPLRFNLLFERFLNPERVNMPDFDVDFCQERREETIKYVQEKYGFDHVAQIITFGKLQAKAVIRDVGRVLQIPYPVVDRLSKMVPTGLNNGHPYTLKDALELEPEFEVECDKDPEIKHLLEIALKLEGLYRNTSTHAAGVVIGNKPLDEILPIYKDTSSDMPVTQFDMKFVEDSSLIKFDFLGLKTLTVLKKALDLIALRGIEVNLSELPIDDKETYQLLSNAETTGVFQLESSGIKKVLRDLEPDKMEDLIAIVSLYRPGPMDNIPSYINRKHGKEEPDYLNPMLEDILKETYGIMIYQEQVMQIAQVLAGYSLGGADLLRRAMGKKKLEIMKEQRVLFVEGAKKKGVSEENSSMIFDQMEKFASYGFNKSHAAAYALIAYQTAYLKAHYPVEFMAATMTLDSQNTDKLGFFKQEVLSMGIEVLTPDVNKSDVFFTVENGAIRYALSALKNVGEGALEKLVQERQENGPFTSLTDFFSRVDLTVLNKRCMESLIKAGAFDELYPNRAEILNNLEKLTETAASVQAQKKSSQFSLFSEETPLKEFKLEKTPAWQHLVKLNKEVEAVGFYLSAHPLDNFVSSFEKLQIRTYNELQKTVRLDGETFTRITGIVQSVKEKISQKSGRKFAFVSASDTTAAYEMVCFSDTYLQSKEMLNSGAPLIFSVKAEAGEDTVRMILQSVSLLEEAMIQKDQILMVDFSKKEALPKIKKVLNSYQGGDGKIILVIKQEEGGVEISLKSTYSISAQLIADLNEIPEITNIR
ncbi:MAG: DNA polymerase III subunit alpha [Alphaproteobacteria bacterium]|nr:DNA polymerase III subunit alpha [Alphaproteobacteria bacterium]